MFYGLSRSPGGGRPASRRRPPYTCEPLPAWVVGRCCQNPKAHVHRMDTSLDRRRENAYKSTHRGEALRLRGAPQTPGAHAAYRGASIRRTPRCARRDGYAIL
jgi:hypothetical protein